MNAYEIAHQNTTGLHYTGPGRHGNQITIDAAELSPGIFEVVALRADGLEMDSVTASNLIEARDNYHKFMRKYVAPEPKRVISPLTGKYAQLREDLKKALEAGRAAEDADPEDGGTCNHDSASICLPRWIAAKVEQAAKEAGTGCFTWNLYCSRRFVFTPNTRAQGNARSRNAEAMTAALRSMGYDAMEYSQMD